MTSLLDLNNEQLEESYAIESNDTSSQIQSLHEIEESNEPEQVQPEVLRQEIEDSDEL